MQQFAGTVRRAGDHDFAAVFLDPLVAAQQERQKHRADVIDAAEVKDQTGGRIGAQGRQHHHRRLLHQVLRHLFYFRRRRDDGDVAVPFDVK